MILNFTFYTYSCTICIKKQNKHVIVPSAQFKLLSGQTGLSTYTFNTHQAKHMVKNCLLFINELH